MLVPRLHLLFDDRVEIDLARVGALLASFDPALEAAVIAMDLESRIAEATFGDFVLRFRAVGEPIPEAALEPSIQLAHLDPEEKAAARAHACFLVMEHAPVEGDAPRMLDQYRALSILAAAFALLGARFIVNLDARTALPAGALHAAPSDVIRLIEGLSPLLLFMGFGKYELALPPELPNRIAPDGRRHAGVWMRTHGGAHFGVPDLARLADGHEEGMATFRAMSEMVVHMIESRAVFSLGDVVQLPDGALAVFRAPAESEAFLLGASQRGESGEHPLLVLEPVSAAPE